MSGHVSPLRTQPPSLASSRWAGSYCGCLVLALGNPSHAEPQETGGQWVLRQHPGFSSDAWQAARRKVVFFGKLGCSHATPSISSAPLARYRLPLSQMNGNSSRFSV